MISPEARRALAVLPKGWRAPDWPSGYFGADLPAYRAREAEFAAAVKQPSLLG